MIDTAILWVFLPTFLLVSATPGMCMTLALTLGISIGLRRTFYMMWGELLGVAVVAIASVVGVATVMLRYPAGFLVLKVLGGGYLIYLAIQMWRSQGKWSVSLEQQTIQVNNIELFLQGLITAIANPKGWAFTVALLPPFIDPQRSLWPQLSVLVAIILCSELLFMTLYATCGRWLRQWLNSDHHLDRLNKITGAMMFGIGIWLWLS